MIRSKWIGLAIFLGLPLAQAQQGPSNPGIAQAKDIVERTLSGQSTGNDAVRLSFQIMNRDGTVQMERAAHLPFYTGEVMRIKVLAGQSGTLYITNINASGQTRNFNPLPVQAGLAAFYPSEPGRALEFAGQVGTETLRVNFVPQVGSGQAYAGQPQPAPVYSPPSGGYVPSYPPTSGGYQPAPAPAPVTPTPAPAYPSTDFGGWGNGGSSANLPPPPGVAPGVNPTWPQTSPAPIAPNPGTWTPGSRPSDYFTGVIGKSYAYAKDIRETVLESNNATYLMRPSNTGPLQFDITIQHRNQ